MNQRWEETNDKTDQIKETLDNGFKKVNETLDRVSEGIEETVKENKEPVDQKVEDSKKETEITKDKRILLTANKNNSNKENNKHLEMKTKKRHPRRLINTREELEIMKNGLINMFNIPITDHEEIINVQDYRRRSNQIVEITYYKTCLLYTSRCV